MSIIANMVLAARESATSDDGTLVGTAKSILRGVDNTTQLAIMQRCSSYIITDHIDKLRRRGLIKTELESAAGRRYAKITPTVLLAEWVAAESRKKPMSEQVLDAMTDEWMTSAEIAEAIGSRPRACHGMLGKLVQRDVVLTKLVTRSIKGGSRRLYKLNREATNG